MSGKTETTHPAHAQARSARTGQRIRRTRDTLGDALVELMREKAFDDITVQEVLDRAGVSRTTFYTHYRDKEDLFLSDVEDFLEWTSTVLIRSGAPARRIAPVQELFSHVSDVRDFYEALVASGKATDLRELGVGYFARSIEQRLVLAAVTMNPAEIRAASHAFAGALFSMLDWWTSHEKAASPQEMDELFHRIVWEGAGHRKI
jgi:AcrR family transcriptional regulator